MSIILQDTKEIRKLIPHERSSKLHRVNDFKGIASILLEWTCILACAWLCQTYFSWYFYLFSVIFIGARYLALGLIMHEGVHQLVSGVFIFSSMNCSTCSSIDAITSIFSSNAMLFVWLIVRDRKRICVQKYP